MQRRPLRGRVLVAAGAVAVLLSGCGNVDLNPGQAAIVNDEKISQSTVDDTVTAACHYIEISSKDNPQAQPLAISDLRSNLTTSKVLTPLYADLIDELGLTIRPADVEKLAGQNPLPDGLDEEDEEILTEYFQELAVLQLSQALIGSNATDPTITDSSQLTTDESAAGADVVAEFMKKQDVEINPQYGSWNGANVAFESGSLSTPVSDAAQAPEIDPETGAKDVSDLPPSQVCGG
jgi:hypothetical protein